MTKPNKADYTKEQWRKLKEKIKLEKAAKRAAKANKIPPRIPIKNLDNNITSFVLGNGLSGTLVDLNAIKELLGHSSLAATQVYTHNSIERLKEVHKQAHPKA